MGKRHRNLFPQICAMDNLRDAYAKAARGRRSSAGCLQFKEEAEVNLAAIQQALLAGTYRPGPPRLFTVYEPKSRQISALQFPDRVVQHALHNIIGPIFDRVLMGRCYACRSGRGTHVGVRAVQAELRRTLREHGDAYFLKTDFRQYFAHIDLAVLWREIHRKIACADTLALCRVFTPTSGTGLPIGNLTSQLWANVYGHIFDRWLVNQGITRWHRYMDDVVIIAPCWRPLAALLSQVQAFVRDTMQLTLSKWMVAHYERGVNFLGYRIWPTHKLLRRSSVTRARRRLRALRSPADASTRQSFLGAWLGHARHANTANLLRNLNLAPIAS